MKHRRHPLRYKGVDVAPWPSDALGAVLSWVLDELRRLGP